MRSSEHRSRRRFIASAVAVVAVILLGAACSDNHSGETATSSMASDDAAGISVDAIPNAVDVTHNPPLLYDPGKKLKLEFELVCPGSPCANATGTVTLEPEGSTAVEEQAVAHGVNLTVKVPTEVLGAQSFRYHADFEVGGGQVAEYPAHGVSMEAVSFDTAQVVDLGDPPWAPEEMERGTLVASGGWGSGPSQFGKSPEGFGPDSFAIAPNGDVVVMDTKNKRLARFDAQGNRTNVPIELSPGEPVVGIEPDGRVDVLYGTAVPPARMERFSADGGAAEETIDLPFAGNDVVRIGDTMYVEADDSWWTPVLRGGAVLSDEEQVTGAFAGIPDAAGEGLVMRKHMREEGNEVRIAQLTSNGVQAWRLTGQAPLLEVDVAAPLPDGRVAVVQSQVVEQKYPQSIVLVLSADGVDRQFAVPMEAYVLGAIEFRLQGSDLYQMRTTKDGFNIWRYDLAQKG